MATLTFTLESKGFRYEDGDYVLTGNKILHGGIFKLVDSGVILKNGLVIGSFHVKIEEDNPRITIGNVGSNEFVGCYELVQGLLSELWDTAEE